MQNYQDNILGYTLIKPKSASKVPLDVFTSQDHIKLYTALKTQINKSGGTDVVTLSEHSGISPVWITELMAQTVIMTDKSLIEHVQLQQKLNQSQNVLQVLSKGFNNIQNLTSVNERYDAVISLKQSIQSLTLESNIFTLEKNPTIVESFLDEYQKPIESTKTGIQAIDSVTGGLRKGNFITVLANSGVGKTNLLLNMAANMLMEGKKVLIFSLEMSTYEIMQRMFSIIGGHNSHDVRDRGESIEKLSGTAEKIRGLELYIISAAGVTSNDVIEQAMELHNQVELDCVMVDYLQRLNDSKSESEYERITRMCRSLKNAAMQLQVPIITPSQVDKQSAKGSYIGVENAVGSKAIGDESDLSLYLFRKESKSQSGLGVDDSELWLTVVKNRHGETGIANEIDFNSTNLRMTIKERSGYTAKQAVDVIDGKDSFSQAVHEANTRYR